MRAFSAAVSLVVCAVLRPVDAQYEDVAPECVPTDSYLNNVMEVVQQQAIMLEDQAGLFERMVGNGTLATTSELMLSTDYWQALGTSFVDVDGNGLPDAWEDGVLTYEEISVAPGANTMLARLANQVARQNGLDASTVSVTQMSTDVDVTGGRRLSTKQEIPVIVTYTVGTTA